MEAARDRIRAFRANYAPYLELNVRTKSVLVARIDAIYRECQDFAAMRIKAAVDEVVRALVPGEAIGR